MSFKKIGTAGDLVRFRCSLRIECTHCAAANTMSALEVAKRCGAGGDIEQFRKRLKCARCGRKAARLIMVLGQTGVGAVPQSTCPGRVSPDHI